MPLPPEYYNTIFLLEDPPSPLPSPFAIITAWNPMDEVTPPEENERRDEELRMLLEVRQIPYFRATGCSPDLAHREPGWAISVAADLAMEIARAFRQRGLWRVEEQRLWLVDCADGRGEDIASFSERLRS